MVKETKEFEFFLPSSCYVFTWDGQRFIGKLGEMVNYNEWYFGLEDRRN